VPISSTPLQFLLRERVTLTGDVTVTRFQRPANLLEPTLVRTASPAEGSLTLSLSDNPLALRGWRVVDAQGQETRIQLTDIELGGTFERALFDFVDPNFFRDRRD
jgi:outer membrane lipoprotein-sorting protein